LVLSKIKNDEIKSSQEIVEEFKNSNLELKRQLLSEVRHQIHSSFLTNELVTFTEKREKQTA
jgi:hypothetical protein